MTELTRYLDEFVEPTLDEFRREPSRRRAYLAFVVIYHAIDRYPLRGQSSVDALREAWRKESEEFEIAEIAAHDFKHGWAKLRKKTAARLFPEDVFPASGMPGDFNGQMLNDTGEVELLVPVAANALEFLRRKAGELRLASEG